MYVHACLGTEFCCVAVTFSTLTTYCLPPLQYHFHDEIRDGEPGAFTAKNMLMKPAIWVETFLETVVDKDGEFLFAALAWFAQKVLCIVCSASACEHCWSIEGWIHSKRRNRLGQDLVEKLVRAHTNIVLREKLQDPFENLLPWDIELVIEEPVAEK